MIASTAQPTATFAQVIDAYADALVDELLASAITIGSGK